MKNTILILSGLLTIFLIGCSTSTGSRYENEEGGLLDKYKNNEEFVEDFNLEPYHAEIEVKKVEEKVLTTKPLNLWYQFNERDTSFVENKTIEKTTDGYRVLVFSSDNLEEAKEVRTKLNSLINQKEVYIDFEPPFYKVKAGDFLEISEATDLSFKLDQMGYKESRVITDKINLFK